MLKLINKFNQYDKYREHSINGLKAVFVTELLFIANFFYTIPNPYFYYFYIPLTAFTAELAGNTLGEKFLFYFYTVMGSILAVFLFGVLQPYKTLFVISVFFYGLCLYAYSLSKIKSLFIPTPIILSLAFYSLNYNTTSVNFYVAINHGLVTFVAMLIVMAGLVFFPRRYYFIIWRRAYILFLEYVINQLNLINNQKNVTTIISQHVPVMTKYFRFLTYKMPFFSIGKITLVCFEMTMQLDHVMKFKDSYSVSSLKGYELLLSEVHTATVKNLPITNFNYDVTDLAFMGRSVYQIIQSWNYLCSKQF